MGDFVEISTAVFDVPRPDYRWRVRAPGWLLDADAVRHPSWKDAERARQQSGAQDSLVPNF